jgi:hypothetical protein
LVTPSSAGTYSENKKASVRFCKEILSANGNTIGNWLDNLEQHREKQDDLCDAFLQGIWYLKHHNQITVADDFHINSIPLS